MGLSVTSHRTSSHTSHQTHPSSCYFVFFSKIYKKEILFVENGQREKERKEMRKRQQERRKRGTVAVAERAGGSGEEHWRRAGSEVTASNADGGATWPARNSGATSQRQQQDRRAPLARAS
ncbi:hypothetical protein Scep_007183 [Stephania cephalantha]|uniref:Uncharacterized protein n=1 Tax=Stephania cephalantha TaxID=152367 RepID=A0AAP0K9J1_9MAGN